MSLRFSPGPLLRLLLGLCTVPNAIHAQHAGMSRAFDLERRGSYAAAAEAYRSVLVTKPGNAAALLGLERVLLPINRSAEILPQVRAALAANPSSGALYGVALRAWAAVEKPDSMRAVAERWALAMPGDEAPYREWGAAALSQRDRAGALAAYRLGRERLGRPYALAAEMAQVAIADGDYATALREWIPAIEKLPGYRLSAVATLSQAPEPVRPQLLRLLARENDFAARQLESELRVRWGDPLGGLRALQSSLPADRGPAVEALRGILDQLRTSRTQEALLAQGRVLEALAGRSSAAQASRLRLEAAQAYSAAGDRDSARRMLTGLADDRSASATVASGAGTTLVAVLVGDRKLEEASRRLADLRPSISSEEYESLRRGIVLGWVRAGELGRADSILGVDSTIEGLALAGKIRLYRGDVPGAIESFKAAGPYAGERADATQRTTLLALLQPIEADSLPALGAALLQVEKGDTAGAARSLEQVASQLPPAKGGAELRLLAGRLAAASGKSGDAERLFRAAAVREAPATAPAAELALAELLLSQGRAGDAVTQLEHLILSYPESALVPQARRALDRARGGVPQT